MHPSNAQSGKAGAGRPMHAGIRDTRTVTQSAKSSSGGSRRMADYSQRTVATGGRTTTRDAR
jgi:hypothetical protein